MGSYFADELRDLGSNPSPVKTIFSDLLKHVLVKDFDSFVDRSPPQVHLLTKSITDQVNRPQKIISFWIMSSSSTA